MNQCHEVFDAGSDWEKVVLGAICIVGNGGFLNEPLHGHGCQSVQSVDIRPPDGEPRVDGIVAATLLWRIKNHPEW